MTLRKNGSRRKEQRGEDAIARRAAYDSLSKAQKIAMLDAMFGTGKGAEKERARLAASK